MVMLSLHYELIYLKVADTSEVLSLQKHSLYLASRTDNMLSSPFILSLIYCNYFPYLLQALKIQTPLSSVFELLLFSISLQFPCDLIQFLVFKYCL